MSGFQALTVSQLNFYTKSLLEGDEQLQRLWLRGEISNCRGRYRSGHLYFSLKDENAAVRCVMFKNSADRLRFEPADGMRVLAAGRVSLYERDGQFQFYADDMQPDGLGALSVAFEQLCARLRAEGLFNEARKRPLPRYPGRIGVVTSKQGAALQDILSILARRWPLAKIVLCPVPVQGEGAAEEISRAIDFLGNARRADLLIVGRGGGSLEDLWAFNEERVVRSIAACRVPVISAVGHETDFTAADFAADLRAPTPSAAAELAAPDRAEVTEKIDALRDSMYGAFSRSLLEKRAALHSMQGALRSPAALVGTKRMRLDLFAGRLRNAMRNRASGARAALSGTAAKLEALSPLRVLARGYAAVYSPEGNVVAGVAGLRRGDRLLLRMRDGTAGVTVEDAARNEEKGSAAG